MSLEIYYQNARSLRTRTQLFQNNLYALDMDIVCITETWLNNTIFDQELITDGYDLHRQDRKYERGPSSRGGGCLIAIKSHYITERLTRFETITNMIENLWLKVKLKEFSLYICLSYISPSCSTPDYLSHITDIRNNISELDDNSRIIVLGDFN